METGQVGGNWYDKYATRNPLAQRLVAGFENTLLDLAARSTARRIHEIGCGEGHLSRLLNRHGYEVRASDVSPSIIRKARRRTAAAGQSIGYRVADLHDLCPDRDGAPLVVCCEVLEHLDDPHVALQRLVTLALPWLIVSVPREPLWRAMNLARGSYVRRLGNTPGHVQQWSKSSFVEFVGSTASVVEVRSPVPWTFVLARTCRS